MLSTLQSVSSQQPYLAVNILMHILQMRTLWFTEATLHTQGVAEPVSIPGCVEPVMLGQSVIFKRFGKGKELVSQVRVTFCKPY